MSRGNTGRRGRRVLQRLSSFELAPRWLKIGGLSLVVLGFLSFAELQAVPYLTATKTDTLLVDNDADNLADPGDTLRYTVTITNRGSTDAAGVVFNDTIDGNTTLVAGSLRSTPIARHDQYASIGNVGITVPAASGVLLNDNDPDGSAISVVPAAGGTLNGGAFAIGSDGAFSYLPPPGFEGTDQFVYEVQDSDGNQDPASVFIVVNEVVWFIDNSQPSAGSGVLTSPFNSISDYSSSAADEAGDIVFVHSGAGAYTSGLTLSNSQVLVGQGATASLASIAGITVPPFSNALPATGGTRPVLTTSSGDAVTLAQNNLLRGFNIADTAGVGLSDNGGTVGSLNASEISISGSGGGIEVDNGGVLSVSFDGLSSTSGSDEGIDLENVSGSFAVSGVSNVINKSSVPAIVVDGNPSIWVNATFQAVSSTNAAHGISLVDMTGSLTVNGGTLSGHSAEAVLLNNASNVSFNNMTIDQGATSNTQGVDATSVSGLSFDNTTVTAGSGNSYALLGSSIRNLTSIDSIFDGGGGNVPNIDGVRITNLLGSNTITDSTFRNGKDINLLIENNINGGGLDTIAISGTAFSNSAGGDHLQVEADGTANLKLVVDASTGGNSTFSGTGQDAIQFEAEGNSTFQVVVTGSTITGNLGSAVNLGAVVNGHLIARIHNLTGLASSGTNVINMINFDNSTIEATIDNNTITSGTAGNGIRVIQEGNGTITTNLANNTISGITQGSGILVQGRAGTGGNGRINATINSNNVTTTGLSSLDGIEVTSGSSAGGDTNTICLNMLDNTSSSGAFDGYLLRHRTGSTFQLQDFTGAATTANITNWVNTVKSNTGSVFVSGASGFTSAPGACATPTVPTGITAVTSAPTTVEQGSSDLLAALRHWVASRNFARSARASTATQAGEPIIGIQSGETINVSLGTLNSGQEVVITFDVTIDDPQTPATNGQVCNQATVSGGNLVSFLTDDPDVGGSSNPTCTQLAPGTIIIAKDQDPDGSSSFGFTSTITGNAAFNVMGDSSVTINNVTPGIYTVTEDDPSAANFTLTGLTCDDGSSSAPSTTDLSTRTATINLESGETVTCTYTNEPANTAPVANDDSYTTDEDTTINMAAPGVLDNDNDDDDDPLTAVLDTTTANGSLNLNADGSFTYTPDADFCGPDSFTYHANDGQADSNTATVDIDVECVDDPPQVSADVTSQTVQYSDHISTVTITAADVDSHLLTIPGIPADVTAFGGCTPDGDGTTCTWTLDGQVNVAESTNTVSVSDGTSSVDATQIVVEPEDATVTFDSANPVSVEVDSDDASGPFSLTVEVSETQPDQAAATAAAGDITLAQVSLVLEPVGPGSPISPDSCSTTDSGSGYSAARELTCDFDDVPVNTYTGAVTVDGGYYSGSGEDVLAVFDPTAGFTTGGGWYIDTGSGDRVNFGYTMKYNKKGTNLKGSLLVIRHTPDGVYRLKSNALDALAIGSGDGFGWASFTGKATYKEPEWPDAIGNYEFVIYVEDHGTPGGGQDRFWVSVERDGEAAEGLSLADPAVDEAVILGGGNIVVPSDDSPRRRGPR